MEQKRIVGSLRAGGLAVLLSLAAASAQAAGGPAIRQGSRVTMNYTLTVDGKVVDSSVGGQPLTYVQGSGQIIPGLEEKLAGMRKGGKKHVTVPPEKGYGPVNPDAFQLVPRSAFKKVKNLKVGSVVNGRTPDGRPLRAKVAALDKDQVTLDLNHPLAGKTLQFDVEIMDVRNGG